MSPFEKAQQDMHETIESFARTLHDAVRQCETPIGLLLVTRIVAILVVRLNSAIDELHEEVTSGHH